MNNIQIALCGPITIPLDHIKKVKNALMTRYEIRFSHINHWDRHSPYDNFMIGRSDAVIVIADSKFGFNCKHLAPGVTKELTEARNKCKPVFIAYKNSSGIINFYSVDLICGYDINKVTGVSGVQGSSGEGGVFERLLENYAEVSFDGKQAEYTAKQRLQKHNGIDAQAELEKMINQDELEKAAIRLMQNSTYGIRCVDSSYNSEQIKFPEVRQVYANTILNPDYLDERLLLMLV